MKKDTNLLDTQDVRAEAATALTPNATNGEKIKALRTAQGMSMAELSRRASMSDRAIRYIEAGEREPSVDAIQKIAAALGVTTDYFMDDATFQASDGSFSANPLLQHIPCLEIPRASAGLSIHAYRIRHP